MINKHQNNLQTAPGTGPKDIAPGAVYLIYLFFEYTDFAGSFLLLCEKNEKSLHEE